jgi:hypothetical protein
MYIAATRKHGLKNKALGGLNSKYSEVENNWAEGTKYFLEWGNEVKHVKNVISSDNVLPKGKATNTVLPNGKATNTVLPKGKASLSPWLVEYIAFHKSSIANGQLKNDAKYIVYECKDGSNKCGGGGDRLISMIKMFYFAMCTNRVLLIDAPFPTPLTDVFNPAQIEWNATFPETPESFPDMNDGVKFQLREDTRGYRIPQTNGKPQKYALYEIWQSDLMAEHLKKNDWNALAESLSYATIANEAFRVLFDFSSAVRDRANELIEEAGLIDPAGVLIPYIGMHFRLGDEHMGVARNFKEFGRSVSREGFLKCYEHLKKSHVDKYSSAYLASDSNQAKKDIAKEDPTIHYSRELKPFHIDLSVRHGDHKKPAKPADFSAEQVYRGVIDTWAEMLVLADSTCLLLSPSMYTFGASIMRDPETCSVPLHNCYNPYSIDGNSQYYGEHIYDRGFTFASGTRVFENINRKIIGQDVKASTRDEKEASTSNVNVKSSKTRSLKLLHFTPIYKVDNCDEAFCPLNQEQTIAIASMSRAVHESKNADVRLATSVFSEEGDIVPTDFIRLNDLVRSTQTEYPELQLSKQMPFVSDIFDNLRAISDFSSYDYVIYTNSDIIVRNDFYDIVAGVIQYGYDGFTINRQTVGKSKLNKRGKKGKLYTADDLHEIYQLKGKFHPGSDCFMMKSDVFQQIEMGDLFLGSTAFANLLFVSGYSILIFP